MKNTTRSLFLSLSLVLGLAVPRSFAQTSAVFQQNANGQTLGTDSCGTTHFASNDNLWTQSAATALDCHNNSYQSDVSNWNIAAYPNGANFNVTIGLPVHLNQSVAVGNLSITGAGALAYDANNSSGGGAHSVTLTFNGGSISNNGTMTSVGVVEAGQTYAFAVNTTLSGSGTMTWGYGTNVVGPGSLTIQTAQKVIGGGLDTVSLPLINQGTITADGSSAFFTHNLITFQNAQVTNTGTIQTTAGGGIQFLDNVTVNNTGGILNSAGSDRIYLLSGVSVTGGTFMSSSSDATRNDLFYANNATLTGVTFASGARFTNDGGGLTLNGAITNNGQILFANTQNGAGPGHFIIASDTTISGTGVILLPASTDNVVSTGKRLTLGAGQTLNAGFSTITGAVTNHGLITAGSDRGLILTGGNYLNDGTIESIGGGLLTITSDANGAYIFENAGGTLRAIDSSQLYFQGGVTVRNGVISSSGTATLNTNGALTLENVTNNGTLHLLRTCFGTTTLAISGGTFTNNGPIDDISGECNPVNIHLIGNETINGTGTMALYRTTTIDSTNGGVFTNGAGHLIGGGSGSTIQASLVNNGEVGSHGDGNQFNLNGPLVTNNGVFTATNASVLQQAGNSTLTNYNATTQTLTGGTYSAYDSAQINLNIGPIAINNAHVFLSVSGQFGAINSLFENDGIFEVLGGRTFSTLSHATNATQAEVASAADALRNKGTIGLDEKSSIVVNGDFAQGSTAVINVTIGGNSPSASAFPLNVTGTARLAGTLNVKLANGFTPAAGQKFQILNASAVSGGFTAVYGADISYTAQGVFIHPNGQPIPTTPSQFLNISTRMQVFGGDKVLIAGFIVTGTDPKRVIIRGIGPSLTVNGALVDPALELHSASATLASNNDWKINDQTGQSQEAEVQAIGIPPSNDKESVIIATLPANNATYTAILSGNGGGNGIGVVEVYDISQSSNSRLANISSRGFVDINDNIMIGGLIIGPTTNGSSNVLVRGIGPSVPLAGALQDPLLELHDGNGATITTNDNWKISDATGQSQEADIRASGAPPSDDRESALLATLAPGNYTAVVRGKNNTTGIGLVEAYNLP
ncbi:MAG: hypothetical protein QOE26_2948 [Verrucomicrobiota bacterium]|jgi:hypothetical protein